MKKRKKHGKAYHPDRNRLIEDCKGISKFHRTGRAEAWQTFNTIFEHILIFKCNVGAEKITTFHSLLDSYYYQVESGCMKKEELFEMAKEYSGKEVDYEPVNDIDVKRCAAGSKYMNWVGSVNLRINNEILADHSIQEQCAIVALHDMGWSNKAVYRFSEIFWKYMNDVYYVTKKDGQKIVCILDDRFRKELDPKECIRILQKDIESRFDVEREDIYDYADDATE